MTKEQFRKALENGQVKIINVGTGYNKEYRASYNRYAILVNGEKLTHYNSDWLLELPYYSKRTQAMAMTVWGISQSFEAKAKLTDQAMYNKIGDYNHDYFYKYVDTIKEI